MRFLAAALTLCAMCASAHALTLDMPLGDLVTTSPGQVEPLILKWRADRQSQADRMIRSTVRTAEGRLVQGATEPRQVPSRGAEVLLPVKVNEYGTFFVVVEISTPSGDDVETASVTIARVRDNRCAGFAPDSPFGMGCYFAMRFNPEELRAAARLAALAGVRMSREELRWDICEPRSGEWRWGQFDRAINEAFRNKIQVLGLLDYWGAYHGKEDTMTSAAVADFCAYARATVRRYKPGGTLARELGWAPGVGVRDWEIWNEPATFWSYSASDFGVLTVAACRAVLAEDPDARPFFSNAGDAFDAKALAAMGGMPFRGVTPHFYIPPRSPREGDLRAAMRRQAAFFRERGFAGPLWISEIGWHCGADPAKQFEVADYMVQSHVFALAGGFKKVFWYNFVADGRDKRASEYGLLNREDLSPKVAYSAYAGMVSHLEGFEFVKPIDFGHNVSAFLFRNRQDGGERAVVWADVGSGSLSWHPNAPDAVRVCDVFGNRIKADDGTGIPLARSPRFIGAAGGLEGLLSQAKVEGIPQVELSLVPPPGDLKAGRELFVQVDNHTSGPIRGTVRIESSALGMDSTGTMYADGRSSGVVRLAIGHRFPQPSNRYPVSVTADLSKAGRLVNRFEISAKTITRGSPTVDGYLDDWTRATPLHLDDAAHAVGINPWMPWNLSATCWFQWDEKNLYFAARVVDNTHCQPHTGNTIWEGDSWQVGVDALADPAVPYREGDGRGRHLVGFSLGPKGEETATWIGGANPARIRLAVRRVQMNTPASEGGLPITEELHYEAAIPLDQLKPLAPKLGVRAGISVLLNDNDGGGRAGWMESSPGIGTGYSPAKFEIFEFE